MLQRRSRRRIAGSHLLPHLPRARPSLLRDVNQHIRPSRMSDSSLVTKNFGVDSEGAKEARDVLSSTLSTILGDRDRDRNGSSSNSSVAVSQAPGTNKALSSPPRTSTSRAVVSPGPQLFSWDRLLLSDDEDGQPDAGSPSRSNGTRAGGPNVTAPGVAVGGNGSDDGSSDDDEWKEHFAKRGADAAAAARQQRAAIPEAHTEEKEDGNRASGSSSPRGSARKRPRETGDGSSVNAGRKPATPCQDQHYGDCSSGRGEDGSGGLALVGERHRSTNLMDCSHSSDAQRSNRSPPAPISLVGGHCVRDGGSNGVASGRTSSGGGDAGQRRCGQGIDEGEEEEEDGKEAKGDREGEEGDEDDVDLVEERLKPTLSNPPFEDPVMRPLVLTDEKGGQRAEVPASVNRYLKDYQREGVEFMYRRVRHADGPKGVILADDMGLGKTVQTISLLLALLKKTGTKQDLKDLIKRKARKVPASAPGKPILIVCPPSVLTSWTKHLADWGHFAVGSITSGGSSTGRTSVQGIADSLANGRLEVVVIGDKLFERSIDTLAGFQWLVVVFDEVHLYKNPKTLKAQAAEKLVDAEVFVGLTGTLIQNNLDEFWCIMNMIQNGCLNRRDYFTEHFTTPILRGMQYEASADAVLLKTARLNELSDIRDRQVLRRVKDDVLSDLLKGKTGIVVFCDLAPVQKRVYKKILALPEFRLLALANHPCPCGRDELSSKCCGDWPKDESSRDGVNPKAVIWKRLHPTGELCGKPGGAIGCPFCCTFPVMSKLQKVSNHPSLLQVNTSLDYPEEKRLADIAFAQVAFDEAARRIMSDHDGDEEGGGGRGSRAGAWDRRLARQTNFLQLCRDETCGKMKTLKVLLKRFKNKHKVLLFSYSTAMLDILQTLCVAEGYTFLRLDGNTPMSHRRGIIERYNATGADAISFNVFLISTKAGGTGLNLQTANKVILYDVNWNPSLDCQAEDRAYRIGQLGNVEVFRLVSTGTIEELTYMRQIYKLQTSAASMGDKAEGGLRQFEGVQGDSSRRGELWGISNLMCFSGESKLLSLRKEHGVDLPPLVAQEDGLVMEPQKHIVNVVKRYVAASTTEENKDLAAQSQASDCGETEGEAEFEDGVWGGISCGDTDARRRHENQELGGVVVRHKEMVAADMQQDLPAGVGSDIDDVDMEEEDGDDEPSGGGGDGGGALSNGVGASAGTKMPVCRTVDDAGAGLGDLAGGQDDHEEESRLTQEPSWALAQTQEPPQHPPSRPLAASPPSTGGVSARTDEGGADESRTAGGPSSQVRVDARGEGGGPGGWGGDQSNQQLDWAPAAQEAFDVLDFDDLPEAREAVEGIQHQLCDMNRKGEAKGGALREEITRQAERSGRVELAPRSLEDVSYSLDTQPPVDFIVDRSSKSPFLGTSTT